MCCLPVDLVFCCAHRGTASGEGLDYELALPTSYWLPRYCGQLCDWLPSCCSYRQLCVVICALMFFCILLAGLWLVANI